MTPLEARRASATPPSTSAARSAASVSLRRRCTSARVRSRGARSRRSGSASRSNLGRCRRPICSPSLAPALPPDQWSQISGGARLAHLTRQLGLEPLQPNLHRLPLLAATDVRLLPRPSHVRGLERDRLGDGRGRGRVPARGRSLDRTLRVQLTNGDRPNVVELMSPGRTRSIALGAGQRVVETIELGRGRRSRASATGSSRCGVGAAIFRA